MEKSCLVTGKSGSLLAEIVRQATDRQRRVLVTRSGRMELDHDDDTTATFSWNRRSALSARSALLHACNLFGRLDEAYVVFAPVSDDSSFHETSIVGIEDRIDAEVKGYIYILREIVGQMLKQGEGRIILALQQPPGRMLSSFEAVTVSSFVALADSLDRYYRSETVRVRKFRTDRDDAEGFAEFILSRTDAGARLRDRIFHSNPWVTFPPGTARFTRGAVR